VRLAEVALDRAATAQELVVETSRLVREWILEQDAEWGAGSTEDGAQLEAELAEWNTEQGWRGPCAVWLDSLRRAWHAARERRIAADVRSALAEEVGLWAWSTEDALVLSRLGEDGAAHWNGDPLATGRRMPPRADLALHAARAVDVGETILVTAYSETVALALETAWRMGKRPEALLAEGLPQLDGRRMAKRLIRAGVRVSLCYDAGLCAAVPRADRLWLSTEAIGTQSFLARVGTSQLVEECARQDVPVSVLATSDKLVPGGELRLPEWAARDTWLLWEDPPDGVRLESQFLELTAVDLPDAFVTELGTETIADLHLRALRVDPASAFDHAARAGAFERDVVAHPLTDTARP